MLCVSIYFNKVSVPHIYEFPVEVALLWIIKILFLIDSSLGCTLQQLSTSNPSLECALCHYLASCYDRLLTGMSPVHNFP